MFFELSQTPYGAFYRNTCVFCQILTVYWSGYGTAVRVKSVIDRHSQKASPLFVQEPVYMPGKHPVLRIFYFRASMDIRLRDNCTLLLKREKKHDLLIAHTSVSVIAVAVVGLMFSVSIDW